MRMLPVALHYLQHRRRYSNLLMVGFAGYVVQNVSLTSPSLVKASLGQ